MSNLLHKLEFPVGIGRKTIIYIDMDGVICDYKKAYLEYVDKYPDFKYPQSQYGFFSDLEPIEGAIDAIMELDSMGYDIYFATAPSYMNPMCLAEKNMWIRKHFDIEWCKKLIIIHNKSLLIGEYLIDDNDNTNNQKDFKGMHLHFGKVSPFFGPLRTWSDILKLFKRIKERE